MDEHCILEDFWTLHKTRTREPWRFQCKSVHNCRIECILQSLVCWFLKRVALITRADWCLVSILTRQKWNFKNVSYITTHFNDLYFEYWSAALICWWIQISYNETANARTFLITLSQFSIRTESMGWKLQ